MKPSVLFVCVHNAGRSQLAAAFLTRLAGDRVQVRSAGSAPADTLNPAVVAAMREVGIDLSAQRPKLLTDDAVQASDVVITMGCGDACPYFPGKRYLDWKLDDPAGRDLAGVRPIRDEIERRVRDLLTELGVSPTDAEPGRAVRIAPMRDEHAAQVLAIYQAGIDAGDATFETRAPSWPDFDAAKDNDHRLVALDGQGRVRGWAAVVPVSDRCAYAGVVEHSVYVHPGAQGRGVGRALLAALLASTDAAGIWTVQSGVFPENEASLALHRRAGFRIIGTRERIGRHHGRWRDVVLLERRSPAVN